MKRDEFLAKYLSEEAYVPGKGFEIYRDPKTGQITMRNQVTNKFITVKDQATFENMLRQMSINPAKTEILIKALEDRLYGENAPPADTDGSNFKPEMLAKLGLVESINIEIGPPGSYLLNGKPVNSNSGHNWNIFRAVAKTYSRFMDKIQQVNKEPADIVIENGKITIVGDDGVTVFGPEPLDPAIAALVNQAA